MKNMMISRFYQGLKWISYLMGHSIMRMNYLAEMDFVIASIHSAFHQPRETIMQRLKTALNNPHVDLIAHPTGRYIGKRVGYDVDVELLIELARDTNTALELNANPHRLDLAAPYYEKPKKQAYRL